MEPLTEAEEYDQYCAELWSDDPDVIITSTPTDLNAPHGSNSPAELDRGDSLVARAVARVTGYLGRV